MSEHEPPGDGERSGLWRRSWRRIRPTGDGKGDRFSRWAGGSLAAGSVAFAAGGFWSFIAQVPRRVHLVKLQWAGGQHAVALLVGALAHAYRAGLDLDMRFLIPFYSTGLFAACYLGWRVFQSKDMRTFAGVGLAATLVAALLNYGQDWLLLAGIAPGRHPRWVYTAAEAMSFAKFTILIVAGGVSILAVPTAAWRIATHRRIKKHWDEARGDSTGEVAIAPPAADEHGRRSVGPAAGGAGDRDLSGAVLPGGARQHWVDGFAHPAAFKAGGTGICLSGGGIRSASVALGALQQLRDCKGLQDVDYVVSVSGGGYTAGGFQLALMPEGGWSADSPAPGDKALPADCLATPADVFAPGAPETDYLRRHSSYIAVNFRQWIVSLGVLLRGVTVSAIIISLIVVTTGVAIARFYRTVPVIDHGDLWKLKPWFLVPGADRSRQAPPFPAIPAGVWVATAAAAAAAVLLFLVLAWLVPVGEHNAAAGRTVRLLARGLAAAAALLAAVGVVLPSLIWASAWLTWQVKPGTPGVAAAGSATFVLSYLGTLIATLWRKRKRFTTGISGLFSLARNRTVKQVLPNSMIQMLLIWIILILLVVAAMLAASWVATSGLDQASWALSFPAALALIAILLDQTSISLHPFYRRRLASAFAVRRGGANVARPYPHHEPTPLSTYGTRREPFPAVTFCAAANVKGQHRTPPGRAALSFGFSDNWMGGPRVGWLRTDFAERLVPKRMKADLTVQAAMAISGAAFASAMGGATSFYEVFLALTNARLGAWLPNPKFVRRKLDEPDDWRIPGFPRIRRLSYYFREVFGIHADDSRMLLCTDGGHYDNLGLVEMLRRRPETVICIDGSAQTGPLNGTLAQAIAMAWEELGVVIKLDGSAYDLVPGTGRLPNSPGMRRRTQASQAAQLDELKNRLSATAVITGTIDYGPTRPEQSERQEPGEGQPGGSASAPPSHRGPTSSQKPQGRLIFAQAALTGDMPYELLHFPQQDPAFPQDSTADQWFDIGQFGAYTRLGQEIGSLAAQQWRP